MKNLFDKSDAKKIVQTFPDVPEALALRVYTSRLIGRESGLVLHGGGNTSVKLKIKNILGDEEEVLFVKGSGRDLSTIDPEGFAGLDLGFIRKFRHLAHLTDDEMQEQLSIRKVRVNSPDPSVEALLHAFLPNRYVDHTHADSILVLTNQKDGQNLVKQALGPGVVVLPYIMPGVPLAKGVIKLYEAHPDVEAIVVMNHGIFTFGDDAAASYSRMIDYVNRAEIFMNQKPGIQTRVPHSNPSGASRDDDIKAARVVQFIRGACAHKDKKGRLRRFYTEIRRAPDILDISLSGDAGEICRTGAITPDHVIRTKNRAVHIGHIPETDEALQKIVHESVDAYQKAYRKYFLSQVNEKQVKVEMLDPFPRIFLAAGVGIVALGLTRKSARIAADIAEHTIRVKSLAGAAGGYVPISDSHAFDMEYWRLQQKKVSKDPGGPLTGQVALVTGAGGAIGFGIADTLMAAGAVVVISDIDEPRLKKVHSILAEKYHESQIEQVVFDVTDYDSVENGLTEISQRVGGIDTVVPNAGIAHVATIETLAPETFEKVIAVNLMGVFNIIKASIPIFKRQGTGGNIILVSSKNVFDPGAAFGAYSASKAGAHQLSKIAALELADLGVRVNMLNPDAVFGDQEVSSKLWDLIGPDRMKSRGLDPEGLKEYYRQRNLLKISVQAEHVGNAVVFFAGESVPTTGATLPIDGGVPAAFPR